jgi:cytochrome c oxidase subunit 2
LISEITRRSRSLIAAVSTLAVVVLSACSGPDRLGIDSAPGELPQNTLDPAGPIAREIDGLWWMVFIIAAVIFVVVQVALVYAIIRFRRRKDEDRPVKQVHGNARLEIVWTIIPAVLLAVVAIPTVATLFDIRNGPDPGDDPLRIEIIGHQWWWEISYPDYGFTTANEVHIPVGRPVVLEMTSADVIHSFWVPRLAGKRDLVPGRDSELTIEADEPGLFLGQCAEFCGLAHADMRLRVFAQTESDFDTWALGQAEPAVLPDEGPAASGWETFQVVCASCHAIDGTTAGANLAPNLTHFASRSTFGGASFANTQEHLREWLANPSDLKPMRPELNDLENGRILGMPNLGLTGDEIDGLIALLETLE